RLCDDDRMRLRLATIEGSRPLQISNATLVLSFLVLFKKESSSTVLLLHFRHAVYRIIKPLPHRHLTIFLLAVSEPLLQSLFDKRICQIAMAELSGFECRLITLSGGQNVHAFLISELRQAL